RLLQRNLITVFSTVNTSVDFYPDVSRREAAVPPANVAHRNAVDAMRHACMTCASFEKVHETSGFSRSPRSPTRTAGDAATRRVHVAGTPAKVYADCRRASDRSRIFGGVQARLRKTAQARRPFRQRGGNSPDRPSTITMAAGASILRYANS